MIKIDKCDYPTCPSCSYLPEIHILNSNPRDIEISCKKHCVCPPGTVRKCTARNQVPGSISFVPSVVGLIIAGEVIKDIIKR